MRKSVLVSLRSVGQCFGVCAVIRDAYTGEVLATTQTRPYGANANAYQDAEALLDAEGYYLAEEH